MDHQMNSELRQISKLARADKYEEALQRLDALLTKHPAEPAVWSLRGYTNNSKGDLLSAVSDLTECIKFRRNEPDDFFTRGRILFKAGRLEEAIVDFTRVLQLCDDHRSDYYRQAAHFFRADAYVRLRQ